MAPSSRNKGGMTKGKLKPTSSLTRLIVVESPRSSPPPLNYNDATNQRRRVSFLTISNGSSEILPIESAIDIKPALLPATLPRKSAAPTSPVNLGPPPRLARRSASPARTIPRMDHDNDSYEIDQNVQIKPTLSSFAKRTAIRSDQEPTTPRRATRSASPAPTLMEDRDVSEVDVKPSAKGVRRSASPAPARVDSGERILLSNRSKFDFKKVPLTGIVEHTEAGNSEGVKDSTSRKISARKCHKLRGREDLIAWFEISAHKRLNKPPHFADSAPGLRVGDLLIWQLTEMADGTNNWGQVSWGSQSSDGHRLIVTDQGQPSFVAESTWKKKYKLQGTRIVT
ncbi:hypothetical protein CPB83DRAFT_841263 [Crepidotus variabilis]|uniref:Uncharacterized protein n=1 Tax=Crepidotus variabilis TaxID=179855 RepID=A0A9P6BCA7_9AGAR|nr:hypothetical protein CPB83DRAFT_841263 [Crepidotus variabilis]